MCCVLSVGRKFVGQIFVLLLFVLIVPQAPSSHFSIATSSHHIPYSKLIALPQALSKVYVNIHDLIDANRNGTRVGVFKTRRELIEYTAKHQKYFPLRRAKEGGPVRGLLVKMRE